MKLNLKIKIFKMNTDEDVPRSHVL